MQANIYRISPFDALVGGIIRFSWKGNQVFKNRCIIRENESNQIVYDSIIESFKFEHTISLDKAILANGKRYNAFILVYDREGNESDIQQLGESFYCLKTPSFGFTNIEDGQVLATTNYECILFYDQDDGEELDSWSITVYNHLHTELSTSGVLYNANDMSYRFSGFNNKNEYFVRGQGLTVRGINLDTGYIKIIVSYGIKDVFSILDPTNLPDIGAVKLKGNVVSSEGKLEHNPIYIANEYIDLRNDILTYSEGFRFDDDFSYVNYFYGLYKPNTKIIAMHGDGIYLEISYRVGNYGSPITSGYFELNVINGSMKYIRISNLLLVLQENTKVGLCLVRKDGLYDIQATILGEV